MEKKILLKLLIIKLFHQKYLKILNATANGNIKKEYDKIFNDIEKDLAKSKSSKNVDQLKNSYKNKRFSKQKL